MLNCKFQIKNGKNIFYIEFIDYIIMHILQVINIFELCINLLCIIPVRYIGSLFLNLYSMLTYNFRNIKLFKNYMNCIFETTISFLLCCIDLETNT